MRRLGHRPELDGIRGVAIALVLGEHAFRFPFHGGYGVEIFFVLSGFLITTLLLEERDATGRIDLGAFYARRARRLLPGLFAMLSIYLAVEFARGDSDALKRTAAAGFYTANFFQAFWPHVIGASGLGPLWSLAEEEQFYLLMPLLLILAARFGRHELARKIALSLVVAVVVERFVLAATGASAQRLYAGPDTGGDGLLLGTALALKLRAAPRASRFAPRWRDLLALAAVTVVFDAMLPFQIGAPIINIGGFLLVACAMTEGSAVRRMLSTRPFVAAGRASYSLYLWNGPAIFWLGRGSIWQGVAATAFTTIAGVVSYRYVETPFRRSRLRRRPFWMPQLQDA